MKSFAIFVTLLTVGPAAAAQHASSCASGYRVVSRYFDAQLKTAWELRQDCAHPQWPARAAAVTPNAAITAAVADDGSAIALIAGTQGILVHAGEVVRLWSQDASSRIEIAGVAEQSAHLGERINVRITHQTEDAGPSFQHINGVVRAAGDVEMVR